MNSSSVALPDPCYRAARLAPRVPIVTGSEAHKMLFCGAPLNTFNPYRSAVLNRRGIPTLVRFARWFLRKANRSIGT